MHILHDNNGNEIWVLGCIKTEVKKIIIVITKVRNTAILKILFIKTLKKVRILHMEVRLAIIFSIIS